MELLEAIRTRRSVKRVTDRRPSRQDIVAILEAARWAPNHHLTQPWRFHVIAGQERTKMGEFVAAAIEREDWPDAAAAAGLAREVRGALLRAPVVIAVTVRRNADPTVDLEDYAAACCATQNLLLAAWSKGIASKWRTAELAVHPAAKRYLGIGPEDRIVAYAYLGYPAEKAVPEPQPRSPDCVTWLGWEE